MRLNYFVIGLLSGFALSWLAGCTLFRKAEEHVPACSVACCAPDYRLPVDIEAEPAWVDPLCELRCGWIGEMGER